MTPIACPAYFAEETQWKHRSKDQPHRNHTARQLGSKHHSNMRRRPHSIYLLWPHTAQLNNHLRENAMGGYDATHRLENTDCVILRRQQDRIIVCLVLKCDRLFTRATIKQFDMR